MPGEDALVGTGLSIGDVLLEKYRIERVLGSGGMGFVVAATHLGLDLTVAIKMLLPAAAKNPELAARFSREARAAAKLKSDHVVRVMDVGTTEYGTPYLVMEHLEGRDLAAVLRERGPLPPDEAVRYALETCEGLAEAHARGIVHRDLKPGNLFLARLPDGGTSIKIVDFGISKSRDEREELSLTSSHAFVGSLAYISPEQLSSSRDADTRADIWSLGVILYEMLTGELPFVAENAPQLMVQLATREPRPILEVKSDLSPELAAAVMRCLEKDRGRRAQTIVEVARAIAPANGDRMVRIVDAATRLAEPADARSVEESRVKVTESAFVEELPPPVSTVRSTSLRMLVLVSVAIVALAALAVFALQGGPEPSVSTPQPPPPPMLRAEEPPIAAPVEVAPPAKPPAPKKKKKTKRDPLDVSPL
jgi:eukaryotic-like serine/threonine-protein kinase